MEEVILNSMIFHMRGNPAFEDSPTFGNDEEILTSLLLKIQNIYILYRAYYMLSQCWLKAGTASYEVGQQ